MNKKITTLEEADAELAFIKKETEALMRDYEEKVQRIVEEKLKLKSSSSS